ncbi:MAG: response regulator [Alphaproteobacteria bacterium]
MLKQYRTRLANVRVLVGASEVNFRRALADGLRSQGFQSIHPFAEFELLADDLRAHMPDLVIMDADFRGGDVIGLVQDIRHRRIGHNPFVAIILTAWHPDEQRVRELLVSGVDGLLVMPVSMDKVLDRVAEIAFNRKPFIVTGDYLGPERRRGDRASELPQVEVPNTLLMKASGKEVSAHLLSAEIDRTMEALHTATIERLGEHVVTRVGHILAAFQAKKIDQDLKVRLERLAGLVESARRLTRGRPYPHIDNLCRALNEVVLSILRQVNKPAPEDLKLLKPLATAVALTLAQGNKSDLVANQIAALVASFEARRRKTG